MKLRMRLDPNNPNDRKYITEKGVDFCRYTSLDLSVVWDISVQLTDNFNDRKEAFFLIFKKLLSLGYITLHRDLKMIFRTPEEWEEIFRAAFPKSYEDYGVNYWDIESSLDFWFIIDECPAYPLYIFDDGDTEWGD